MVLGAFAVSAVLLGGWVLTEMLAEHPLLDPRLFRIPALRAASLGMLSVFFGMFGFFFLNASLMQYGRGFTVLQAGLGVLPMTAPLVIGARQVPRLARMIGDRQVVALAFLLIALGLDGLALALHHSYPVYAIWLVVVGVGVTLALPPRPLRSPQRSRGIRPASRAACSQPPANSAARSASRSSEPS